MQTRNFFIENNTYLLFIVIVGRNVRLSKIELCKEITYRLK